MRSEMCSLHLTHPSPHTHAHTWSSGQPPGEQSWTSCRSRDSNPQPWVTSGFKSNALSIRPTTALERRERVIETIKCMRSPHTSYRCRGRRVIESIKCMHSPHTSYRWRGKRVIETIKCMGIIRRPLLTRTSGGNLARTPGTHPYSLREVPWVECASTPPHCCNFELETLNFLFLNFLLLNNFFFI